MASYQTAVHLWKNPKTGIWFLVWSEGGNPKRKSTRTKKVANAQAILRAALAELGNPSPEMPNMTFHQAIDAWLRDRARPLRGLCRGTIREYTTFTSQMKTLVGSEKLAASIRPTDIRGYLDRFQNDFGFGATTVRKRYGALRMLFSWMVEEDIVIKSPVKKGDATLARAKQKPPWTAQGYKALQKAVMREADAEGVSAAARQTFLDLSDLFSVVWHSGMRSIQAYRLRWVDIDMESMVWLLRSPRPNKGGEKLQPIHKNLTGLLERRKLLGRETVFPGKWQMISFWKSFKKKNPEFKGWSLHQARSRVVTELRAMGEQAAAMGLVGHTQEETNNLYNHAGAEEFRKQLNRL